MCQLANALQGACNEVQGPQKVKSATFAPAGANLPYFFLFAALFWNLDKSDGFLFKGGEGYDSETSLDDNILSPFLYIDLSWM